MKLLFLLIFILHSLLFSDDLEALLENYEQSSDLSQKTKDESAGNLIVYTRDDLERMQVESLKDILKSLRFFSYEENRIGNTDIFNADPLTYYSQTVRIYLNNTELLTSLMGSGMIMFGDMEMDFIDHVEIYEGFPSLEFGIEPATIVIRLYTKTAEHDEGGRVKALYGSNGINKQNVYYTSQDENYEYMFYANRTDEKKDTYEKEGETLRRDRRIERFYASINDENNKLELHVQTTSSDAFLGTLIGMNGAVPRSTKIDSQFINISSESKFMNNSLTLNMSYIDEEEDIDYQYSDYVELFVPTTYSSINVNRFKQTIYQEAFTIGLKKDFIFDNHSITTGLQYRYKSFDISDIEFTYINGITSQPDVKSYDKQNIYSIFLQDSISFYERHLLTLSASNKYYMRNKDAKNIDTTQLRFGYTYTNKGFVFKTFISSQEFAPEPYMSISPAYGNIDLDKDTYTSIYQEISYTTSKTIYKTVFGAGYNEDLTLIDQETGIVINNDRDINAIYGSLEFTYKFREKDKLELVASAFYIENPYDNYIMVKHYNYMARVLNTVNKFDIFNELVINTGYEDMSNSFDYSLGVRYEATKDLHISIKGENLFNDSFEQSYVTQVNPITNTSDEITVPTIERRLFISMEYLF